MPIDNLHTLWHSHLPLGVTCGCGHRALVDPATLGAHDGNMMELRILKLRCTACHARGDFTTTVFARQDQVDAFLAPPIGKPSF